MKKILLLLFVAAMTISCAVTIPMQSNLSDQTMLLAKNKNIKANYNLKSNVVDGPIALTSVTRNGNESSNQGSLEYASETAFKRMWSAYFSSKFNDYADDEMDVLVELVDLRLRKQSGTSIGESMLTGNTKYNVEAIAVVYFSVNYEGKNYENEFEVVASDYNESQSMQSGNNYYTANQTNPTQQKSKLLESCLNKSIIQFENFVSSVILNN
ncbi:hypothetical protein [Psychroflexus salis]|uniref:Lipoprotein n=1 Tax=Psychroflexus salis TaxID=1526574 RepID=A0A916ZQI1_9FLAO|nr:hypothetical protein [Psychroflexus salis]GGE09117.1 hypothetical protein GCM10010831_08340 [Psychroflexus salis]